MPGRIARGRLPWALLALALGYTSLIAGPLWNVRATLAHWLDELTREAAGIPQPIAIGLALFGAAALIFVVARQVRDVELRPYASIAPVLAVFSGLVLSGLRGQLPFPGAFGAQLGLAALTLALMGGALIGRTEFSARVLGWALAVLPSFALLCALCALRGDSDPIATLQRVDAPMRAYLALLAASAIALGLIGNFAHYLVRKEQQAWAPPSLRLAPDAITPVNLRAATLSAPPLRQTQRRASPAAFAASYAPGTQRPSRAPVALALDDLELGRKRTSPFRALLWLAPTIAALAAVAAYFLVVKPERDQALLVTPARTSVGTEQLTDRMSRYLEQQGRMAPGATKPVVTPLEPTPAPLAAPAQQLAVREEPKPERVHRHHHRSRREHKAEAKPVVAKLEAEPKPEAKPEQAVKAEPPKPAKPTQNERELDLDELVQKALKSGKQSAADDPILGL